MSAASRSAAAAAIRRRERAAELAVLELYDYRRGVAGHDYGAGQRTRELQRRRRELEQIVDRLDRHEVRLAARRLAASRLRRLEREGYRAHTPASSRTIATWQSIAAAANADELEVYVAGDVVEIVAGPFRGVAVVNVSTIAGPRDTVVVERGSQRVAVYAEQLERDELGIELRP